MKTLLRSCFVADGDTNHKELFLRNFLAIQEAGLGFEIIEDQTIFNVIKDFVRAHNHVPDVSTLREHFRRKNEDEIWNRIEQLIVLKPVVQGDFLSRLNQQADNRRIRLWGEYLKEAAVITSTGMEIVEGKDKKFLKGPIDSARFLLERSQSIVAPTLSTRLSGELIGDGQDFLNEYERVESDPLAGIGQHSGIEQIDVATNGAKKFELWIHAAFTGGLKSTFALNWVYNQAIYHKHDSVYFSLEMPYQQCRRMLYVMHSSHRKFKSVRYTLGIQREPDVTVGLDYVRLRDGVLTPNERKFLFEYVVPDLQDKTNQYGKIHIEVADPDKNDFTVIDLRQKAELLYARVPFAMVVVDHVGLMSPRKWRSNTTENLNEVIRDLKRMAMSFNRGAGMAVLALFQISREGYRSALKKKAMTGVAGYDLTHLSYANEAERSGDIISATWVDEELMDKNRAQFQCLKSRDQAPFKPFFARVEWPCRRLLTCYEVPQVQAQDLKQQKEAVNKMAKILDQ